MKCIHVHVHMYVTSLGPREKKLSQKTGHIHVSMVSFKSAFGQMSFFFLKESEKGNFDQKKGLRKWGLG